MQDKTNTFPEEFIHYLDRVCKNAAKLLDSEVSSIYLVEDDIAIMRAGYGYEKYRINVAKFKIGEGITGKVIKSGEAVILGLDDISELAEVSIRVDNKSIQPRWLCQSILAVPLRINKEVIGLIKVENKKSGTYSSDDLQTYINKSMA